MAGMLFLGRYEAMRLLGEGGMARVHLTRRVDGGQLAAVKVLHQRYAGIAHYRDAFRREIEFLGRIRHPGAVQLYESSMTDPHGPCFAMEYVDGIPLDDLVRRYGALDPHRVGWLLGQLCAVVHAMHGQGIVHRDLKPGNVMVVNADSEGERIKIFDFGMAGRLAANSRSVYIAPEKLTSHTANAGFGTPEYSCPHQLRGEDVDHRADIYSLGVMVYELLTGQRPFDGCAVSEMMVNGYHQPPAPMVRRGGSAVISRLVEAVVQACLADNPADRPKSARDLAELYGSAIGKQIWDEADPPPLAAVAVPSAPEAASSPDATVYQLEAWMPEQIALVKLRGFLKDIGGEVVESVPGLIRVRLKWCRRAISPAPALGLWARLGLVKKPAPVAEFDPIDMDVLIEKPGLDASGRVLISLRLHPAADGTIETGDAWRSWCDNIHVNLSAYLMAKRN